MASQNLNELMSKLSLETEKQDELTFYLASLRRRRKTNYLFSKTALFILNLDGSSWIYLELKKLTNRMYGVAQIVKIWKYSSTEIM